MTQSNKSMRLLALALILLSPAVAFAAAADYPSQDPSDAWAPNRPARQQDPESVRAQAKRRVAQRIAERDRAMQGTFDPDAQPGAMPRQSRMQQPPIEQQRITQTAYGEPMMQQQPDGQSMGPQPYGQPMMGMPGDGYDPTNVGFCDPPSLPAQPGDCCCGWLGGYPPRCCGQLWRALFGPCCGFGGCGRCGCGGYGPCCRCCQCGPPGRFWVRDEYLGFWGKGDSLPVLVATNPAGTLPTTTPLFGGNTVNGGYRSGNWIQGGMWLDCCRIWGLQADYFFLGTATTNYFAGSDGSPVIGRPFTDANTGAASQELVAFPGQIVGTVAVTDSTSFQGAGVNLLHNLCCSCCGCGDQGCGLCFQGQYCSRLDLIAGFRYYNLNDNLGVGESLVSTSQTTGVPVGTVINVGDSFITHNNFYGGTIGLQLTKYRNRWVHEGSAQVALGANHQTISINGSTVTSFPGQPTSVAQGGLLALSSNIGNYSHTNFMAIPQISTRLGYRITPRLTAFVGYTFIYWGQVARAGEQVNTTINPNLLPPATGGGPNQPSFVLHQANFWAQGITIGGQLNF